MSFISKDSPFPYRYKVVVPVAKLSTSPDEKPVSVSNETGGLDGGT